MSVNRKLRFLSLGGKHEALALTHLLEGCHEDVVLDSNQSVVRHLINAIILATAENKKLALVLSEKVSKDVRRKLKKLKLEHVIWSFDQGKNKEAVQHIIQLPKEVNTAHTDGLWNQVYNLHELWNYRNDVLGKKSLGENTLEHTLAQFILLHWDKQVFHINTHLNVSQFEFNTKEYWFLRGRINQGCQLYRKVYRDLKGLIDLHPVFFDMYSADEAYLVVFELIRKMGDQVRHLKLSLDQWITEYRSRCYQSMDQTCAQLRKRILVLRQGIAEQLDDHSRKPSSTSWSFRSPGTTKIKSAESDLIEAYAGLIHWMEEKRISDHSEMITSRDLGHIFQMLQDGLSNFGSFRRRFKRSVDQHLVKMNRHTIKDENMLADFTHINTGIRALITEVNGYQIFKDHWEDHSLELRSQIDMLERLESRIGRIESEIGMLKEYIRWNQFMQTLDEKGQALLELLYQEEVENWTSIFDAWYLSHYIACQDLIHLGDDHFEMEWKPLWSKTKGQQIKYTAQQLSTAIAEKTKDFVKVHRQFRKWIEKNQENDDLAMEQALFAKCFPVVIFDHLEKDEAIMFEADWVLTDLPSYTTKTKVLQHIKVGKNDTNPCINPPQLSSNVLHSPHTERMDDVRKVACFILESGLDLELWQNKSQVLLVSTGHEAKKLLQPGLSRNMTRVALKSTADLELLTEALVNNQGRRFDLLWSEADRDEKDRYAIFVLSNFVETLRLAGFEIHYLCWTQWMKNKVILNHLIQPKETVVYRKSNPSHMA